MNLPLLTALLTLLGRMAGACPDPRPRRDAVELALALLCTEGPRTITNALRWLGRTDQDWTGDYRLFSQIGWPTHAFFDPVLSAAATQRLQSQGPFYCLVAGIGYSGIGCAILCPDED